VSKPSPECSMSKTARSQFAALRMWPMAGVMNSLTQNPTLTSRLSNKSRNVGFAIRSSSCSALSSNHLGLERGKVFLAPNDRAVPDHARDIAQGADILARVAIENDEVSP